MNPPDPLSLAEAACREKPGDPARHRERARQLLARRQLPEAIAAALRALDLGPDDPENWYSVFLTRLRAGQAEDAAALCRAWLERMPEHPLPRHMLAALGGGAPPPRMADDLVRRLFDAFAPTFERDLSDLDYLAPALCRTALVEHAALAPGDTLPRVLDAGCGTGLSGAALRDLAGHLTGVDLSAGMLAVAREKGLHDELHEAELTAWLRAPGAGFDAIVLADVLVYFGELTGLVQAAAARLHPGGLLVGTCETSGADAPWGMTTAGRYAHREDYLLEALAEAGLEIWTIEAAPIRRERGHPVPGVVFTAGRVSVPGG